MSWSHCTEKKVITAVHENNLHSTEAEEGINYIEGAVIDQSHESPVINT